MFSALSKLFLLLFLLPGDARGQESICFADTFVHQLTDNQGRDIRLTCALSYPGPSGDILLGGNVGGHVFLSRINQQGSLRWRRVIRTGSESTELSTLSELVVDPAGFIAGVGNTLNDNIEKAYLFRYDPVSDSLLYFLEPGFSSELTGIKLLNNNEYLLTGSRLGEPNPVFISAYTQRVWREDGQASEPAIRYDYRGDESFLDATSAPDGTQYIVGNISATGGAGDIRASVSRIDPDGVPVWSTFGPVGGDVNARLYALDVELISNQLFVLHWGNIGTITGGLNTTVYLSCMDPNSGTVLWSRDYDITDFNGESGLELEAHNGGLLIYGYSLIGKRDPWLMQVRLTGEIVWARSYEQPGNALIYVRANQQLHTDDEGITAVASFGYTDGTPRSGLLLRLDREGRTDAGCLNVRTLEVTTLPLVNDWQPAILELNEVPTNWADASNGMETTDLTAANDCGTDCEDCAGRSIRQAFVCRSDSVFIAGEFRHLEGVYADTLATAATNGCDSIRFTELVVSDGPTATYTVRRECGLEQARVDVTASSLAQPLRYEWSTPEASGPTAYLPAGNYRVTINDAIGCRPLSLEVNVEAIAQTNATLRMTPPLCPGDSTGTIFLQPSGAGSLKLLPIGGFVPDALNDLPAGSYQLIFQDSTGCEVFRQVTLPPASPVEVDIVGPQRVLLGDETRLTINYGQERTFVSDTWMVNDSVYDNTSELILQPLEDGLVYLNSVTDQGCLATDSILLEVYRAAPRLYLPTGFSPNNDGINDVFLPGLGPDIEAITDWEIYDRWGNQLWAYRGNEWWNGGQSGPGLYVYHLTATLIDGSTIELKGEVVLLR